MLTSLTEAKQYLLTCQTLSVIEQQQDESAIVAAFQMFWSSYPELEEFTQHMKGIVLFPAILYCMVTDRPLSNTELKGCDKSVSLHMATSCRPMQPDPEPGVPALSQSYHL